MQHRLLKQLMSNSPSVSDNKIVQLLVEAELGQATHQENHTRQIASGNLVVNQGQYTLSSPPPEEKPTARLRI